MKRILAVCIAWCVIVGVAGSTGPAAAPEGLFYQISNITALKQGQYDGTTPFSTLKKHGDFGIGTVNGLDGEMVALDGTFYQVPTDGKARIIGDAVITPFAVVTFFGAGRTVPITGAKDLKAFQEALDRHIAYDDRVWAIKVSGTFGPMKLRSVPRQSTPYPNLQAALEHQVVFDRDHATGTLVGFRFPSFMEGVNVAGYHFHFISADRSYGGHVLDCTVTDAQVTVTGAARFQVQFLDGVTNPN